MGVQVARNLNPRRRPSKLRARNPEPKILRPETLNHVEWHNDPVAGSVASGMPGKLAVRAPL